MTRVKSYIPVIWPASLIIFFVVNFILYVFVIKLSFSSWSWENALQVTSMDRLVSLLAVCLFSFGMYYFIGMIRILKRTLKEIDDDLP